MFSVLFSSRIKPRKNLFVAMQGRIGVILGEAALSCGIVPGHRHVAVLGDADVHWLSPNHELIQMLAGDFGHPSVRHLNQGRVLRQV